MRFALKLRIWLTFATAAAACGPAHTSVRTQFHHPLLRQSHGPGRSPESRRASVTPGAPEARPAKNASLAHRRFAHPLLNRYETPSRGADPLPRFHQPVDRRLAIARRARTWLGHPGRDRFRTPKGSFSRDCSGFVLAVYASEGLALDRWLRPSGERSRVQSLYRMARRHGRLHHNKVPTIGDLVFFSNTFDRNRDGRLNDPLTHVGIVERVDADGTASIIHHVRGGVLRYRLNRFHPDRRRDPKTRKALNHYLRVGRDKASKNSKRLTGELFHAFATLIR